jgi:hypothetical protein
MLASPGTMASLRVFTCVTARRDAQITCFHRFPDSTVPASAFVYGKIMPILAVFGSQLIPPVATLSPGHGTQRGVPVDTSRTRPAGHAGRVVRSIGVKVLSCHVIVKPVAGARSVVSVIVPA